MAVQLPANDFAEPIADGDEPLYASRRKIYPKAVSGPFRRAKTGLLLLTLGIYYILPFVRWNRGINAPDQAVLIDFPSRRFYFFFIEIWPQEVYYLTGLLILAAVVLFLMNALAGRVWCGYLCPQTVWTDLFLFVERKVEGDRTQRIALDAGPWTVNKVTRKIAKHAIWLIIAWWTGGVWVLYFADAPTLVKELATFQAPAIAWISIGILTFTTYSLAGLMREQVCIYMCPWPRIQAALTDEYALNVTYRYDRGEPRYSLKKAQVAHDAGLPAGDCIDCSQCVWACPTGVDIRNGNQLGCIQCGLCIDACDSIMAKVGKPQRLIAYDNDINAQRRAQGLPSQYKLLRTRTLLYAGIIVSVSFVMIFALATRSDLGVSLIHDRNPTFVRLKDGAVRNAYTIRIANKYLERRLFLINVEGFEPGNFQILGNTTNTMVVEVDPDRTQEFRLLMTTYAAIPPDASIPIRVVVTDVKTGQTARATGHFRGP
ncbi:MAG: cytochrome c oxidase accessory protein CcoG [Xanthobacteraceae bacterium]|nr:cytochrome c oxidase accessory protein CcoG [Xanthobacteraceae bacterium]